MASPLLQSSMVFVLMTLFLLPSCDAQVKGCHFDSIYSFGVKDVMMIDELANAFHLPSPKFYTRKEYGRLHYGASFATQEALALGKHFLEHRGILVPSADAFTDSVTSQHVSFGAYLPGFCYWYDCRKKLERALFIVDYGSNDYKYAFLNDKSIQEVEQYTPRIARTIVNLISEIQKEGVSNILVPGMPPLGCLPGYISLLHNVNPANFDANNCHIGLNNFAKNHNEHLKHAISETWPEGPLVDSHALAELGDTVTYSQILYVDYYNAFMALLRDNPSHNRRALFLEDGFHLAAEANKFIVKKLISVHNFIQPEIHLPKVTHCVM